MNQRIKGMRKKWWLYVDKFSHSTIYAYIILSKLLP